MATTKQCQMIAGRMVEFQDRFEKLPNSDAQYVIQNTGEAIDLLVKAIIGRSFNAVPVPDKILSDRISTFPIPSTKEKFVARKKFYLDTRKDAKVRIAFIDSNFKKFFLPKIEAPFGGRSVIVQKLESASSNGTILNQVGINLISTTLTEMYAMMAAQPNGEYGNLNHDGKKNLFFIEDFKGNLRLVVIYYYGDGWNIFAYPLLNPANIWEPGSRVLHGDVFFPAYSVLKMGKPELKKQR